MSFPKHQDHISVLVDRILSNKKWIAHASRESRRKDESVRSEPPYLFTLTLSSMLLMLTLTEKRRQSPAGMTRYSLDLACSKGWPKLSRDYVYKGKRGQLTCWYEQVELLRHALAHGNITLNGRVSGVIESFDMSTTRGKKWKATATAAQTGEMVDFLAEHLPKKVAV